jgi:hypothetical protein
MIERGLGRERRGRWRGGSQYERGIGKDDPDLV